MIILITASLSSEKCRASHRIEKTSRSTKHDKHYSILDRRDELEPLVWFWVCLFDVVLRDDSPRT